MSDIKYILKNYLKISEEDYQDLLQEIIQKEYDFLGTKTPGK